LTWSRSNYLVAQQEREPCEVVVLSLVDTAQTKLPAIELLLGAQVGKSLSRPGRTMTSTPPLSIA